jgi:Domain of unknown function (DUF4327)
MTAVTLKSSFSKEHELSAIRSEVRQLIEERKISRHQPIYVLCRYIPAREWIYFESELEKADYLLRDPIGDLLSSEQWYDD